MKGVMIILGTDRIKENGEGKRPKSLGRGSRTATSHLREGRVEGGAQKVPLRSTTYEHAPGVVVMLNAWKRRTNVSHTHLKEPCSA